MPKKKLEFKLVKILNLKLKVMQNTHVSLNDFGGVFDFIRQGGVNIRAHHFRLVAISVRNHVCCPVTPWEV